MPLTVTAWPVFPDPRTPAFLGAGFLFGQVGAERYRVTSPGALSPYDELIDGVLLEFDSQPAAEVWRFKDSSGDYVLDVFSTATPLGIPPFSVQWLLQITKPAEPRYDVTIRELFPVAIALRSGPAVPIPPPGAKIPNPVTFTPRNFTATA